MEIQANATVLDCWTTAKGIPCYHPVMLIRKTHVLAELILSKAPWTPDHGQCYPKQSVHTARSALCAADLRSPKKPTVRAYAANCRYKLRYASHLQS